MGGRMIGIILVTHSEFAMGMKKAAEMIAGSQEKLDAISFMEGESIEALSEKIKETAQRYEDKSEKYVVMVDMHGATPFNAACLALAQFDTHILTGVNLPMLLSLLMSRDTDSDYSELLSSCTKDAGESVQDVGMVEMFGKTKKGEKHDCFSSM